MGLSLFAIALKRSLPIKGIKKFFNPEGFFEKIANIFIIELRE